MITDEEFRRISVFMKQRYGIDLSQKKVIVNGRLENYIRSNGWHNFNEYMDVVERDKSGTQEKMLVNFLTTNHSLSILIISRRLCFPALRKRKCAPRICVSGAEPPLPAKNPI